MTENTHNKITVLGATGYTGQLIVAELQRLKLPFNIAGRNIQKLNLLQQQLGLNSDVKQIVADALQPQTFAALLEGTKVLINCAGPFTTLGEAVVKASSEAGVHYLDITGEQPFIARVFDQYDLPATLKNCALIPACGVEYALSNWLAAIAAHELEPLDTIVTATNVLAIQPTAGTQLSLFKALGEPGIGWEKGRRVRKFTASQVRDFSFPSGVRRGVWSPFGDTITLPRQFKVNNVASYVILPAPLATSLPFFAPILPVTTRLAGLILEPWLKATSGPALEKRQQARWEMLALASSDTGKRRATLTGHDAYCLTAVIIGYAAQQLLSPDFSLKGALGPAQAFEAQAALRYLRDFGVNFEVKML